MDVARQDFDEVAQVGDQSRIGQVVQVLHDDDDLAKTCQLGHQVAEEGLAQAAAGYRCQRTQVDEGWVDSSQTTQESSAETYRVVVAGSGSSQANSSSG